MISLKSAVSELDRLTEAAERQQKAANRYVEWWRLSLESVQDHVFGLHPTAGRRSSAEWKRMTGGLKANSPETELSTAPRIAGEVLGEFAREVQRQQSEELRSVKTLLEALAAATAGVRRRSDGYGEQFQAVGKSLEELSRLEDPDALRQRLSTEAASLRDMVTRMTRENREALAAMQTDMSTFQTRLAKAEAAAATDVLTGLANRRELEQQLEARIQSAQVFCVLMFDLDEFKSVNDRFGHDCGDQVLKAFSSVLASEIRPGDFVSRWGGDEFVVLLNCELKDALRRSQAIAQKLTTRYEISIGHRITGISMRASSGVAEFRSGESAMDIIKRADAAMYAAKQANARPRVGPA